jgi:peroxiredoxin
VGKRFDSSFLIGMAAGVAATLILLIVAAAGLAFAYPSLRKAAIAETEKNLEAPPLPGTVQADFNWQLTALDGTSLSLESLEGDVIFVTFWSPECPYCVAEMGSIQGLYEIIAEDGVRFVCATSDKYRAGVETFAEEYAVTVPLYTYEGGAPEVYKHRVTPAAFIIGRDGRIAWKHEGAAKWDDEVMVQYLRGLLVKEV